MFAIALIGTAQRQSVTQATAEKGRRKRQGEEDEEKEEVREKKKREEIDKYFD